MHGFEYHAPDNVADGGRRARQGRRQAARRRPDPAADDETAPRRAEHIVDLRKIEGLAGVSREGEAIVIGAMTRHADVAASPIVHDAIKGLGALAVLIGDPAVRHRGTIGGSLANNDPAADYPAAALALGATIVTNKREIAADDYFKGLFETALEKTRSSRK